MRGFSKIYEDAVELQIDLHESSRPSKADFMREVERIRSLQASSGLTLDQTIKVVEVLEADRRNELMVELLNQIERSTLAIGQAIAEAVGER